MSSRRARRESPRVVFTTGLTHHLHPRPAVPQAPETRKARPRGGRPQPGEAQARPRAKAEVPTEPEPVAGWVTRGEARALLDVDDSGLTDLLGGYKLSRGWVEVYSKAEILALRAIVKKLR